MRFAKTLLDRQPLLSAFLTMVIAFVIAGTLEKAFTAALDAQSTAGALARFSAGVLVLFAFGRIGTCGGPGISTPIRDWGRNWWIPTLIMSLLVVPRYLADTVDWSGLQYSSRHALDWLLRAAATGFLEEVLFRGACFYILYRKWGTTRSGLQRAALAQALLFGALHLTSLVNRDLVYVLFQVCFAAVIGYSFAGLVAYTRTLWPAIVLHAFINAVGSLDNHFAASGYLFHEDTLPTMVAIIGAYVVFGALPGYWCLKRAPLSVAATPIAG